MKLPVSFEVPLITEESRYRMHTRYTTYIRVDRTKNTKPINETSKEERETPFNVRLKPTRKTVG